MQWSLIQIKIYWYKWQRAVHLHRVPLQPQAERPLDGAANEWIPIISGMSQGSVLGLLFVIYTSKMFEFAENRLFAYADDSTLLATIHKPADRPAVSATLDRDLARIQEWCNN